MSYLHRFFAGNSSALTCIQHTLLSARVVRIATAYFEPSGFQCLQDTLMGKTLHLLVGREEGGRDRAEDVINEFVDKLVAYPLERRMRAMKQMLNSLENNLLLISVGEATEDGMLLDARYLYHHAKLYIADEQAAVVTSANMSYHGLVKSREAGYVVQDSEDVSYFVQQFDAYFQKAESITQALIEKLRAYIQAYPPFDVYARALVELYGLPEAELSTQLPPLARYQQPVVARALQSLIDYRGAMLIASTGLGKTVMAAHIVAYLKMQDKIDRVIVVCPAGLRENWRRFMRSAVTSSVEFSYNALSAEDSLRNASVRNLDYELKHITSKTLIILDESHHVRNAEATGGEYKLRYERLRSAVHDRSAQLLMLTATPFSRDIQDVNFQLKLLPKSIHASMNYLFNEPTTWQVETSAELPELQPCAVLTTPSVVYHFSERDTNGERYVLFSGNERRYFPRSLKIHTEVYANPLDDILATLLNNRLLAKAKQNRMTSQRTLFDDFDEMDEGQIAGTFNAHIMSQFCSSPAQVTDLFKKLEREGGFNRMRFANQQDLTNFVREYQAHVQACQTPEYDEKLNRVLQIIKNVGQQKVVIFCYYVETAKALALAIRQHLPEVEVETTAGSDIDSVDNILRSFAPIANEVPEEEREGEEIQVLVATGALAEGFNLQDASILINYDLPWTVLILAQRMGRILRPWQEPREITIYNFIPSTMNDTRIQMAMNWQQRLIDRNQQHQSFADIPVLMDKNQHMGGDGLEMTSLAKQLQAFEGDVSLNLQQTMDFIKNAEKLQSSSFLDDLANLTVDDRSRVLQLPPGFRSARLANGKSKLFVLFQYRKRYYPALFDDSAQPITDSIRRDDIMNEIRCDHAEPIAPPTHYPDDDDFDSWLDRARNQWAYINNYNITEVNITCAMVML